MSGLDPTTQPRGKPIAWCDTCQNTGEANCYCGGDLCVCENNGFMPCPACDGGDRLATGDDYGDYPEFDAEGR